MLPVIGAPILGKGDSNSMVKSAIPHILGSTSQPYSLKFSSAGTWRGKLCLKGLVGRDGEDGDS